MISDKILTLITDRIDFANDDLELLVEAQASAAANAVKAGITFENAVALEFPDDPTAQEAAVTVAENVVDFASQIGSAFPALTGEQAAKFKELFTAVFDQPGEIETAGEALFNACVDNILAIQALVTYVNAL